MSRVVVHIDLDAFYAQVECVRLGLDPRTTPVGCQQWNSLIAVSYPARPFGVTRMDSAEDAKRKCPHIILVHTDVIGAPMDDGKSIMDMGQRTVQDEPMRWSRSDGKVSLERYRQASAKVLETVRSCVGESPLERASIDESYLDLTELVEAKLSENGPRFVPEIDELLMVCADSVILGGRIDPANSLEDAKLLMAAKITSEIRAKVFEVCGYTCSAGIAHNKTLAKLATSANKPDKQTICPTAAVVEVLNQTPLRKIRFLGGKLGETICSTWAVETAGEAQKITIDQLREILTDEKTVQFVYNIVRGIDQAEIVEKDKPKSLQAIKSFHPGPETNWAGIERWVKVLATEIDHRMEIDEGTYKRMASKLAISYRCVSGAFGPMVRRAIPMCRSLSTEQSRAMLIETAALKSLRSATDFSFPCAALGLSASNFLEKVPFEQTLSRFFSESQHQSNVAIKVTEPMKSLGTKPRVKRDRKNRTLDDIFSVKRKPSAIHAKDNSCRNLDQAPLDHRLEQELKDYELARQLQEEEDRLARLNSENAR
mmetsp:Transcript_1898/g.3423  ORF Transcript_1898/g.3423 Transcript_1898/m.3423 type:complete len:541 (-) Transcript_1898:1015-2637(-)